MLEKRMMLCAALCLAFALGACAPAASDTEVSASPETTDDGVLAVETVNPEDHYDPTAEPELAGGYLFGANDKYPNAKIELYKRITDKFNMMGTAELVVTLEDGAEYRAELPKSWCDDYYTPEIKVTEYPNGTLIALKYENSSGRFPVLTFAWLSDGGLEFIKMPFGDYEYYGDENLFDFKWTGDKTFELTCNPNGEKHSYEVNTEYYKSIAMKDFSEFDRQSEDSAEGECIIEIDTEGIRENGRVGFRFLLYYGEYGVYFGHADVELRFDPETCSFELDSMKITSYTDEMDGKTIDVVTER